MNHKYKVLTSAIALIVLVVIFYFIANAITTYTGYFVTDEKINKPTNFQLCLEEQDITLYINSANSKKTLENLELFKYLNYISIINCNINNKPCITDKVSKFPAYIINGNKIEEAINIFKLSDLSGCKIN